MGFDDFCRFFECYSILSEQQQTKQTNYSSLTLFAFLDTQNTLWGSIIKEWNKFQEEILVCFWGYECSFRKNVSNCSVNCMA